MGGFPLQSGYLQCDTSNIKNPYSHECCLPPIPILTSNSKKALSVTLTVTISLYLYVGQTLTKNEFSKSRQMMFFSISLISMLKKL